MPLDPNFLDRLVLLRLSKGPAPMLDLFGAASFKSVTFALDIGVFETLAEAGKPLPAGELADRLQSHPDGVAMLCNFLVTVAGSSATGERRRFVDSCAFL